MPSYEVRIELKKGVSDSEGTNVKKALNLLGFNVIDVRSVKVYEIEFESGDPDAEMEAMCQKLLANPVIHHYSYRKIDDRRGGP